MRMRNKGFTLVEILIVVVILGILAAIVVPQFTSASNEAVKGALQSQLQTISSQIELYRVRNSGAYPDLGADQSEANNFGWGILVAEDYLKDVPFNGYTASGIVQPGDGTGEDDAMAADRDAGFGWVWDETAGEVFAAGYDPDNNLLFHEPDFGDDGVDP